MAVVLFGKNLLHSNLSLGAIIIGGMMLLSYFLSFFISADKLTWEFPLSVLSAAIPIFILSRHMHIRQILLFTYTLLWGIRLFAHLVRRISVDKLDRRLDYIRHHMWARLLYFLGMAAMSFACLLPFTLVNSIRPQFQPNFGVMDVLGIVFFLSGWFLEMIADIQLFRWRHNAENEGLVCNTGLWSHMRHPNYVGEFLQWWGMFMLSTPSLYGLEWLLVLSPVFISLMTMFVSGIPPAEKVTRDEFVNDPEYQTYLEDSGMFFPYFSRRNSTMDNPTASQTSTSHRNQSAVSQPATATRGTRGLASGGVRMRTDDPRGKMRSQIDADTSGMISPPVGVGISS